MKSRKVKAYQKKLSTIPLEESGSEEDFKDEESSDDNRDIKVEDSSEEEEVLPITDDEESKEEEDDDEDLPKLDNWGKRKGIYYNADFVDQDRGKSYREEDAQKENEECEAGALQLESMMSSLSTGLWFSKNYREEKVSKEPQNKLDEDITDSEKEEESEWQKLEHEKKVGPKVLELREEYKAKVEEINSRLAPLIELERTLNLDEKLAFYIKLKYQIALHYMLNITFYLNLKNKGNLPANHPIIEEIDKFKKLDDEFNTKRNYQKEIDFLIRELQHKDSSFLAKELSDKRSKHAEAKTKIPKLKKSVTIQDEEMELELDQSNATVENSEEKRKITYQIAKNKGLKQRRNKRYRNPRVNNKIKFKKACIRRKGQVRQVVKEMNRYGGEFTGISSHVVRSVKFK